MLKLLTLSLMFLCACHGDTEKMARIVGGMNANQDQWNYVVALYQWW